MTTRAVTLMILPVFTKAFILHLCLERDLCRPWYNTAWSNWGNYLLELFYMHIPCWTVDTICMIHKREWVLAHNSIRMGFSGIGIRVPLKSNISKTIWRGTCLDVGNYCQRKCSRFCIHNTASYWEMASKFCSKSGHDKKSEVSLVRTFVSCAEV